MTRSTLAREDVSLQLRLADVLLLERQDKDLRLWFTDAFDADPYASLAELAKQLSEDLDVTISKWTIRRWLDQVGHDAD